MEARLDTDTTIFCDRSAWRQHRVQLRITEEEGLAVSELVQDVQKRKDGTRPFRWLQIVVKPLFVRTAAHALGTDAEGLPSALRRFFEIAPCRSLFDLMDYLDRNDIPYDYRACTDKDALFRPAPNMPSRG